MKILFIGGNHRRHLYYLNKINQQFKVAGCLIVRREEMIPSPPKKISKLDLINFKRHFRQRIETEKKFFGEQKLPWCQQLEVDFNDLNSKRSVKFVKSIDPDLVLILGSGLIKEPLYSNLPKHSINLHLGLSPRYKGSATLFWPFYFLEPNFAGSTFHYIIDAADAGDIIHQVTPILERSDEIHDVACKTVIDSSKEAIKLLEIFEKKGAWKTHKQKSSGKLFLNSDFKPEHLRVIYNLYNNDIVKKYLDGKLKPKTPFLIRQF